jgi:WD and tetratricopeptide repeat-containing protein 1
MLQEVEVCPQDPHLFWSAGEDGMIRQYDTRLSDQKAYGSPNVLINLATAGPRGGLVECKGVDVNSAAPHLMAVACGDPYVRVFDRRRVGTGGPDKNRQGIPET